MSKANPPSNLLWIDKKFNQKGDNEILSAPGPDKKIVIYLYRKANLGDGENRVYFHWEGESEEMFDGRLWYCGVDAMNLVSVPRHGPENKKLLVNLSENHSVSVTLAYKIEDV